MKITNILSKIITSLGIVQEGFNIDELLEQIRLGATTKNYLVYEYENKLNK